MCQIQTFYLLSTPPSCSFLGSGNPVYYCSYGLYRNVLICQWHSENSDQTKYSELQGKRFLYGESQSTSLSVAVLLKKKKNDEMMRLRPIYYRYRYCSQKYGGTVTAHDRECQERIGFRSAVVAVVLAVVADSTGSNAQEPVCSRPDGITRTGLPPVTRKSSASFLEILVT